MIKLRLIALILSLLLPVTVLAEQKKEQKSTVEILHSNINMMMQDTASWLDNLAGNDNENKVASANGYLLLGWLPRTSDLADIDAKFKVRLKLPNWNERIALVIDNDEDDLKLDYEADEIETNHENEDINLAVQYIKQVNSNFKIKNRIGISRAQLYARTELKRTWQFESYQVQLTPRIDYFSSDGWAPAVKTAFEYPLMSSSLLSLSASWQKVKKEKNPRQKVGFYHIKKIQQKQLLVTGLQYTNNKYSDESYLASVRFRNQFYKKWLHFELEPFVELNQDNRYKTELGLALRLIGYYGK
ncbi:hypothetical protein [Pseudoalteromonas denitrificans]|uniref:Uncharacterized protein n=1 Tax=Pseudoalteromonas denitrificans DSM 6059 TaxID=1123010 RepID=A0A1I1PBE2_9GAMM|nr:hypothetical protein [Pseudoalteromonas denitrificans]SFD04968.1 hypothetical protein SAMN02745724_03316 [Pseudoalteromonas denitrificans DSM 6059]